MKKLLLSISLAISAISFAQINDTQGFEIDNGNFTNTGFFRSKFAQICSGDYALIRNLYDGAKTGNTIFSSSLSSGAAIDVSFKYRTFFYALQGGKVNGEMIVEYSTDAGATYTLLQQIDLTADITSCKTFTAVIPESAVPKNSNFKLRVTGNQKTGGDFYLILDDFKLAQSTLAVADIKKNEVKIYPNPMQEVLQFSKSESIEKVTISDMSGRVVKTINNPSQSNNIKDLKTGQYIINIQHKDGTTQSIKSLKK